MASRITLTTDPAQEHTPLHVSQTVYLILTKGGVYTQTTVQRIVERVNYWCNRYLISPRVVMAQILHETGWFKFGGDVLWWQFNFAGLGATGGIIGHQFVEFINQKDYFRISTFMKPSIAKGYEPDKDKIDWEKSIDRGVQAVVQHHCVYLYGKQYNWPRGTENDPLVDPRYQAVLKANLADSVMNVGQYGGKWAADPAYSNKLVEVANLLPVQEAQMPTPIFTLPFPLRVAHIPWENSNRTRELSLASGRGYITVHETGNPSIGANAEMHRAFVHGKNGYGGGGTANPPYEGVSFTYVVDDHEAIELVPRGEKTWQASDGANGPGNSSVSIETCINTDGNFTKTLDNLANLIVWLIVNDSNLSVDRIVQHNHWARDNKNCPTIMRSNGGKGWETLLRTVRERYAALQQPAPPPADPNALQVNGFWIINEIYHKWKSLGENTLPIFGYPLAGMRRYTIDGVERDGQIFERGVLAVYEEGTPDGVPIGHPFRVRMLTLQEQDLVVAYAIDEGEIEPFD